MGNPLGFHASVSTSFLSEWPAGYELSLTLLRHAQKATLTAVPTELKH